MVSSEVQISLPQYSLFGRWTLGNVNSSFTDDEHCKGLARRVHDKHLRGVLTAWPEAVRRASIDYGMSPSNSRHSAAKRMRYSVGVGC